MSHYNAPTRDMRFVINELLGLEKLAELPGLEEAKPDLVDAIIEEAARFSGEVLAPLNRVGDTDGAKLEGETVRATPGFAEAYQQFVESGWNGAAASPEYGGMGLPEVVATAAQEMWQSSNMAWGLCPMLTAGAIEALKHHGSDEQKSLYLEKMVSGQWAGAMDLTEPSAGSDLSVIRTRAVPEGDRYRLFGQKIFITWGEHEMAENIVHLVLARTPDAPAGVKGISLFIVPKYLVNADGSLGERNDYRCTALEHKLGIHGSPTCVMSYGDNEGAIGYLVGEEGKGLAYMFTMMNEARHKVGVQGLAIAERAYQQAVAYARERVQGRPVGHKDANPVPIAHHPDVRRMLMTMRSAIEAMRALAYSAAASMDEARHHPDAERRAHQQSRVDLLIPIVKGWCTELGLEMTSLGVQVHGGMGFIEETGAAQHLRDARIAPIYEGTNGIQANDLVGRKLLRDNGQAMQTLVAELRQNIASLSELTPLAGWQQPLNAGLEQLEAATEWLLSNGAADPVQATANSYHYMMLAGYVTGAGLMARGAFLAQQAIDAGSDDPFYRQKLATAQFYIEQLLPRAKAHAESVSHGSSAVMAIPVDEL
ncbi:acyl-CoA dehydrogenase [Alkalilimnicola ehrlichii]|uniref:3-methylmercaptopropionyl-CoA dehydrogenase n=1 Tax=Alkalilimnicola ehrlichii TaxID=351052 RepID=A0A3E0X2N9_9GAMM|nr:acyl-CoA dehydrogenase [Alkalilimnicola ehrlichii]RFA29018.1 acyl-CoA dehydrogenase [Alkalilimnicola ehrlichii]RFA38653.1 acyl-CoA dehydrogenase [Alkalilimnicola ehrlichii]